MSCETCPWMFAIRRVRLCHSALNTPSLVLSLEVGPAQYMDVDHPVYKCILFKRHSMWLWSYPLEDPFYIISKIVDQITSFPRSRYLVFSDPPGAKIGNGGATMYVLEQLELTLPSEQLDRGETVTLFSTFLKHSWLRITAFIVSQILPSSPHSSFIHCPLYHLLIYSILPPLPPNYLSSFPLPLSPLLLSPPPAKVMVIHAGGYSQRLPNVSVTGKVFMALPCGRLHTDNNLHLPCTQA